MFIPQKLDNIMDTVFFIVCKIYLLFGFIKVECADVDKYQVNKIVLTWPEAMVINALVSGVFLGKK